MPTAPTPSAASFTLKEKWQYTLLGFIVVGGSFLLGRRLVRQTLATAEEKNTFQEGNPAAFAQQIQMAFHNDGWPGTDVAALRQVLLSIPSIAVFKKVMNAYQRLYNQSLMLDMKTALKTTEYNEMLAILAAKPAKGDLAVAPQLTLVQYQAWAQRLKAAFDKTYGPFPGTDEAAIKAVFLEIPSQAAFQQLGRVYQALYGNELDSDLRSELEFWEYPSYMRLITDKPTT